MNERWEGELAKLDRLGPSDDLRSRVGHVPLLEHPLPRQRHRVVIIATSLAIGLVAVAWVVITIRPTSSPPLPGSVVVGTSRIEIVPATDGSMSASWLFNGSTFVGDPVEVVVSKESVPGGGFLGVDNAVLDRTGLSLADPPLMSIPSDVEIDSNIPDTILLAFEPGEGAQYVEWGRMTRLPTPTDLHRLEPGKRYRIVVAGLAQGNALFQFAFDVDVTRPGRPAVQSPIPYPRDNAIGGGIAIGAGSVWVGIASGDRNADGSIVRLDPATNRIVAEIPIAGPTFRHRVAATDDAVWVASSVDGVVQRIDPETNSVVASIDIGTELSALTADQDAVWVIAIDDRSDAGRQNQARLVRIDPSANEVVADVPLGSAATGYEDGIVLSQGSVWILGSRLVSEDSEDGGDLVRVDTATDTIEATIPVDGFRMVLAEDGRSIWVRSPKDGLFDERGEPWIWRTIDTVTNEVSAPFAFGSGLDSGLSIVDQGVVWAVSYDENESPVVVGFDPETREVAVTSKPIQSYFTEVVIDVTSDTAWVTTMDGIVRVDL